MKKVAKKKRVSKKKLYLVFLKTVPEQIVDNDISGIGTFICSIGKDYYEGEIFDEEEKAKEIYRNIRDIGESVKYKKVIIE